jgi:ABC-type thiamine transport system ATPase subunit
VVVETAVFRLEGVTRRYGDLVALDNVSLDVGVNEYVSFLGPSGSGKTTLLRVIAGFEPPDSGRVFFEGRDITHLPAHERGVGFVFQNFALFPHLSVIKNVGFGLTYGKSPLSAAEVDRRSREMIDMVGLGGLEERGVDQISGQRDTGHDRLASCHARLDRWQPIRCHLDDDHGLRAGLPILRRLRAVALETIEAESRALHQRAADCVSALDWRGQFSGAGCD